MVCALMRKTNNIDRKDDATVEDDMLGVVVKGQEGGYRLC